MLRVAIIGAGISGLSCAIELKNHGIIPTIFEKNERIGDLPGYLVCSLRLFNSSILNPMNYLKKNYNINLINIQTLNEIIMVSPNKITAAKGNHGYIFEKGMPDTSLENQLFSVLNIPITFNTYVNINDIKNDFDKIVVATGSQIIPTELNIANIKFYAQIRIAKVLGNFKPGILKIWLNKNYAKNGYGYLVTKSVKQGELVLIVPDIQHSKLDNYWETFISGENFDYNIISINDIEHIIGYPSSAQHDNIYFTGNSAGMIDTFLGFGSIRSIESGIFAARSIALNLDYNNLIKPLMNEVKYMNDYRKMIDLLNNDDYDKLLAFIGLPVIKQLLYNNALYKAKHGIFFPKIINFIKQLQT